MVRGPGRASATNMGRARRAGQGLSRRGGGEGQERSTGMVVEGLHTCYSNTGGRLCRFCPIVHIVILRQPRTPFGNFNLLALCLKPNKTRISLYFCDLSTVPDNPDTSNCLDRTSLAPVLASQPSLSLQLGLPLSCTLSTTTM